MQKQGRNTPSLILLFASARFGKLHIVHSQIADPEKFLKAGTAVALCKIRTVAEFDLVGLIGVAVISSSLSTKYAIEFKAKSLL